VVDDDAPVREALSAALADRYTVHTAASGASACALLRVHPIAAIILDAVLRGEHGLDLVERFRKLSPAPIVILTGHGTEDLAVRALRAQVAEYLKKPVSVAELLGVLGRLIPETQQAADLMARARRYLDEHPPRAFRSADLAERLGASETHVRRLFRAAYGQTPRQYLAEIRVRRAADLLRRDGRGVKEAALGVGYTDLRLFRRTFTRFIGMTPALWRRRHQG
jgi:YesN/AraC family two-component response regulator